MRILKYRLPFPHGILTIPTSAIVRAVQMQHGHPTLWAQVSTRTPPLSTDFVVQAYATGQEIPGDPGVYLGTVQFDDGTVWHYFYDR